MSSLPSPKKPWQANQLSNPNVAQAAESLSTPTLGNISDEKLVSNSENGFAPQSNQPNPNHNLQPQMPYDQSYQPAHNPGYPSMDYGPQAFGGTYGQQPFMGYGSGGYSGGVGGFPLNTYGNSMFNPYGQQMGMFGQPPMSFMSQMQMNTQPAFQLIERVVNTFSGFAQMLSSTYFATYSSFNAMVGVADQFAHLRNYMRNLFNFRSFVRSIQRYIYRLLGWKVKVHKDDLTFNEFQKFNATQKVSFKPLIMFFVITFGLPYLLHRIMKKMYQHSHPNVPIIQTGQQQFNNSVINGKIENIEFAKALFDFVPQNNNQMEVPFKKDDLVAVLKKTDEQGNPSNWWTGRTRDGRIGLFPNNYVQLLDLNASSSIPKEEHSKQKEEVKKE